MEKAINKFCPRSGRPVAHDSLTEYMDSPLVFVILVVEMILLKI